jgi:hypothetical protein
MLHPRRFRLLDLAGHWRRFVVKPDFRPPRRRRRKERHTAVAASLVSVHRLIKAQARRIAVRAQVLDMPRPTDLVAVVRKLTLLQIDPTAAVAPSADLAAWRRLGSSY